MTSPIGFVPPRTSYTAKPDRLVDTPPAPANKWDGYELIAVNAINIGENFEKYLFWDCGYRAVLSLFW
jgi:hypothetical protein